MCKKPCYGLKYCANCYTTKAQLGRKPWNFGIKTGIIPKTAFKKGIRFNPEGEFKKGIGKRFNGTNQEYKAVHAWINYHGGTPMICEFCGTGLNLEWANISGDYKRELNDWVRLCKKCHFAYDRKGLVI